MSTEDTSNNSAAGGGAEGGNAEANNGTPNIDNVLKNIKSEFSRKLESQNQTMEQLNAQIANLIEQVKPKAAPVEENLEDLAYNPAKLVETVVTKAVEASNKVVDQRTREAAAVNTVFTSMSQKFPEFSDQGSDAYKKASELYERLPKNLKNTAEGMKMAMSEAAIELGLVPSERRRSRNADDYVGTGSGGNRARGDAEVEVSPKTTEFAKLLWESKGKNYDSKVQEGIKKIKKSKTFGKWSE
jgi:hypothetical protein